MLEDNDATGVSTEATGSPSSAPLDANLETQPAADTGEAKAGEEIKPPTEEDDLPEEANTAYGTHKYRKSDEEVFEQLDRMEAKLDQVIEMLRPGAQTSAKVPYVAPEQPAGLSPNQILANAQVNGQAAEAE